MVLVIDADGWYGNEGSRVYSAHGTEGEARKVVRGSRQFALVSTGGVAGEERVGTRIPRASLDALLASGWRRVQS